MTYRLAFAFLFALCVSAPSWAEESPKPDDAVAFDLSAEDWVTTKTAHVALGVEAAVSATTAGTMRADMSKAVNDAAKGDWRLTNFNRTQDQTGMERWSVTFDARLPESALNGLADAVKKASKAGMQITVSDIDFTPTLEETEAVRAALRARLYKEAADQLTALNAAVPGRNYRISQITFDSAMPPPMMPRVMHRPMMAMAMASGASGTVSAAPEQQEDHAEKLSMDAHVVLAALAPVAGH